jgi:hypothetical protein
VKKAFLLIFITFTGLIFYQIILGKNGIIESYRIKRQKEKLLFFKSVLIKRNNELSNYLKYLQNNKNSLEDKANNLGFFLNEKKLLRIYTEDESNQMPIRNSYLYEKLTLNKLFEEIKNVSGDNNKIDVLRSWIEVIFYIFFGFFMFLIIFGTHKTDE